MVKLVIYFFLFLFGQALGSFLNCLIYRLETKQSPLQGRSYCPYCKHLLGWQDLIPVLSFLALKGRCRYCGRKISLQYPLVEIATGLIFLLIFTFHFSLFTFQNLLIISCQLLIACFLIIIFVYDLKHFIIPDKVILPAIALTFFYQLFRILNFENWNLFFIWNLEFGILNFLLAAFGAAAFFGAIVLISQGKWLGLGDIKLAFFMGLFLGLPNILVALFFAFLIGAIIGIGLILAKKKTLKSEIPLGPFLVTGTFLALFWGEKIINWYLHLFW